LKEAVSILKETFYEWMDDQAPTLGAALAYYTLAPLLIISISIAGLAFGRDAAQGQIFDQLRGLLGNASGRGMQNIVQNASAEPKTGLVATVVGFVTLLFGASGVFGQLQVSLDTICVQPKPGRGVLGIIRDRILSFGFILVVGFLLLVSLLLTAAISFVGQRFGEMVPGMEALIQVLNTILSLGVITLHFAMMFKLLPDAKIAWHDVWIGRSLRRCTPIGSARTSRPRATRLRCRSEFRGSVPVIGGCVNRLSFYRPLAHGADNLGNAAAPLKVGLEGQHVLKSVQIDAIYGYFLLPWNSILKASTPLARMPFWFRWSFRDRLPG
jgi:uncharacterized BrkB/YihY/UPF0761 family membrane protein